MVRAEKRKISKKYEIFACIGENDNWYNDLMETIVTSANFKGPSWSVNLQSKYFVKFNQQIEFHRSMIVNSDIRDSI